MMTLQTMRKLLVVTLLVATALKAGVPEEIKAAEKAWGQAVQARDFAALQNTYTPDLIYAHSTGIIENLQQYMDRLKTGAQKYDQVIHESTKVVPYGANAAVAHSLMRMIGTSNGKPFNDHVMTMHFWVKEGGKWRLAAHQTTKLPQ